MATMTAPAATAVRTDAATPARGTQIDGGPTGPAAGRPATPVRRRRMLSLFADRGIATKIMIVVGVLGLTSLTAGVISDINLRGVAAAAASMADIQSGLSADLADVNELQVTARLLVAQVGAANTDTERVDWAEQIAATDAELEAAADAITATVGGQMPVWNSFLENWAAWKEVRDTKQ